MTMHRVQAGAVDQAGWTSASSTEGAFTVDMPCPFNDFTVTDNSQGSKTRRTYTVGCLRADRRKFSVTRVEYRDEQADAHTFFQKAARGEPWPKAKVVKSSFKGLPAVDVELNDTARCGFIRIVHAGPDNVLLVVEAPSDACSGLAAMSQQFFGSLRVDAR